MTPPAIYLFVYGTLRRAGVHSMNQLLGAAAFVRLGVLPGRLYDLGDYPGAVVDHRADTVIHGEVYVLHDPLGTLEQLDRYEACTDNHPSPHEYARTTQTIRLEDGSSIVAWVYLYQWSTEGLCQIPTGNWLQR